MVAVVVEEATVDSFEAKVAHSPDELVVVEFWGENCRNCEVFEAEMPERSEMIAAWQ